MRRLNAIFLALSILAAAPALQAAEQGHMQTALDKLQEARAALDKASGDKGGHRGNAMKAINQAMDEIRAGIEYDRKNVSKSEKDQPAKETKGAKGATEPKK